MKPFFITKGIFQLEKPFPLSEKIKTIDLPTRDVKEDEELLITGAGMVDKEEVQPGEYLKSYKPKVTTCKNKIWYSGIEDYNAIICHRNEMGHKTLLVSEKFFSSLKKKKNINK